MTFPLDFKDMWEPATDGTWSLFHRDYRGNNASVNQYEHGLYWYISIKVHTSTET